MVGARGWGRDGELAFNGSRVSVWDDKKSAIDGGW